MKFTKTAVALAVAGIAAAPMMASATTTLSGVVELRISANNDDVDGTADDEADPVIGTGDVLFGISHEHTLNSGLTGYGSLRADLDRLSNATNDDGSKTLGSADSVYVGVKGGFGDLRFGEIPNGVEYGQLANDIFDVAPETNGGISYTGGFGPATVGLNFSPGRNSDMVGAGVKFNVGGFTIGLGAEERDELANMAVGASFGFAGASVAAHFATNEVDGSDDDREIIGVKVGYGVGHLTGAVTFMTQELGTAEEDVVRLDLGYGLGGNTTLSTRINSFGGDRDDGDWRIQLSKTF